MHRAQPEFNRICVQAARDRAYAQHIEALHRIRPSVDTRAPVTPKKIGRDYKRYENEKERSMTIQRDNHRLVGKIDTVMKEEHFPSAPPQRPYTLQGKWQRDEMSRITYENHKILTAVQTRRPTLNRNDWLLHRLDHQYQITKMSEFKKTVPMSEILRNELRTSKTSTGKRPGTNRESFKEGRLPKPSESKSLFEDEEHATASTSETQSSSPNKPTQQTNKVEDSPKTEKVSSPSEDSPKPVEDAPKPVEDVPKPVEDVPKPVEEVKEAEEVQNIEAEEEKKAETEEEKANGRLDNQFDTMADGLMG